MRKPHFLKAELLSGNTTLFEIFISQKEKNGKFYSFIYNILGKEGKLEHPLVALSVKHWNSFLE